MKTALFLASLALATLAPTVAAEDDTDRTPTQEKREAGTGSRIQRLPDITVIPGSISRGTSHVHRTERRPERVDETAFLAGTD